MIRLIVSRLLLAIPLLFGVATLIFLLTHVLPGDVAAQLAGPDSSPATIEAIREQLGLNAPLWQQYLDFLGGLVRGDLGASLVTGRPVTDELFSRLGSTLVLVAVGMLVATGLGLLVGALVVFARRGKRLGRFAISLGLSTPDFVLGIVLIYVVFYLLGWAPAPTGQLGFGAARPPAVTGSSLVDAVIAGDWTTASDAAAHLVLPALALALVYSASIGKVAEAAFRDAKAAPAMDYARLVNLRTGTRAGYLTVAALPPTLTYAGTAFAYMLGGVVLIEQVFSWGGMAQFAAQSIAARDLTVIQGFVVVVSVFTFAIYLLLDLLYHAVDPRVKL